MVARRLRVARRRLKFLRFKARNGNWQTHVQQRRRRSLDDGGDGEEEEGDLEFEFEVDMAYSGLPVPSDNPYETLNVLIGEIKAAASDAGPEGFVALLAESGSLETQDGVAPVSVGQHCDPASNPSTCPLIEGKQTEREACRPRDRKCTCLKFAYAASPSADTQVLGFSFF